ncbi:MAG TPA: aminopeptidase P family protein [Acidocella sp.]|jgi:Xaa-Pro aminopeptidase|nr:aminopeptidase P family protein [Acidocella sp.]
MSSVHSQKLALLRGVLAREELDGFIIPRADEHLGEYVPPNAERLAFLTGFTGSAGLAVVLRGKAAVFSDGRYTLQLERETDPALWERRHIIEDKPEDWLCANAAGQRIGYDPWLISPDGLKRFTGVELVPVAHNPVDEIWTDRPALPLAPAVPHGKAFAGESSVAKRARLAEMLRAAGQDAAILTDPASLAWLFNIRGADLEFCPFALGYALLNDDATATLFMAAQKLTPELLAHLGPDITVEERDALPGALAALKGKTVRYDPASMPAWFETALREAGAKIAEAPDPVALPRACKNETEQNGTRAAHLRDGVAMVNFFHWLSTAKGQTELSASVKLREFRADGAKFRGESFPAISGAGEDGAIIHYRVTEETDRPIRANEVYLIDSGGQYLDGTTDVTRTIWTGPDEAPEEIKENVTRVLAGHIALARAVFPEGVTGAHLDAFARQELWRAGLDYDHGTGHGVGSYLSVHEGPAGISRAAKPVPLQPGMILSNEPGFYLPGAYGVRLENLMLVQPADFPEARKKFLGFETLTLVPFDRALIEPELLSSDALTWLNAYHTRVEDELMPHVTAAAREWLHKACAPL